MALVSTEKILTIAVLCIWVTQAAADTNCYARAYLPGSSGEANVLTVLESMRTATASVEGRYYTVRLENPEVFGVSSCDVSIGVDDCIACLSTSVDNIKAVCPRCLGASDVQGTDCRVQYL
ncbi:cysteine-rich repeat secretory protein 15-like [Asparagus officinalis]|uniref:cysteine-rich repeat secretory protein 15-like n=1 Tax=Asparagus officinalis TaxID=4686 RepID=UPI00098E5114|nr:cysteine-rich repeat secretory protein 15-like [Asparagus officinalis]